MPFDFKLDPFKNLAEEIRSAEASGVNEPTAMSLATANKNGLPDVRAILFKGVVRGGLSFYTNYDSPKSLELNENPYASVLFFWAAIHEQIRISGRVDKLTRAESEAYFLSRPRLSQIGAWASRQSQEIPTFEYLEEQVKIFEAKFSGGNVPCPPNWGGYRIVPSRFEFWFAREGRLHERYVYDRADVGNEWHRKLMSP